MTVSNLTDPGIEPHISRTDGDVVNNIPDQLLYDSNLLVVFRYKDTIDSLQAELEDSRMKGRRRGASGTSPSPIKRVTMADTTPTIHGYVTMYCNKQLRCRFIWLNPTVVRQFKMKSKIKSSLYSRYYAKTCNEW